MSYGAEQIEKGGMRYMMTQKIKKFLKKAKQRKMRRVSVDEVPDKNKYQGWAG